MNTTEFYGLPIYNRDDLFSVNHYNDGMRSLDAAMHAMHEEKVAVSPITEVMLANEIPMDIFDSSEYTSVLEIISNILEISDYNFFYLTINHGKEITDKPVGASDYCKLMVCGIYDVVVDSTDGTTETSSNQFMLTWVDLQNGYQWTATYTKNTTTLSEWRRFDNLEDQKKTILPIVMEDVLTGTSVELLGYIIEQCRTYNHYTFTCDEMITRDDNGITITETVTWLVDVFLIRGSELDGYSYRVTKTQVDSPYTVMLNEYNTRLGTYTSVNWTQLYPITDDTPVSPTSSDWLYEEVDMTDLDTVEINPYRYYKLTNIGELLNVVLASKSTSRVASYKIEFTLAEDVPVISIGENITWAKNSSPMENANTTYLITIENGYGNAIEI